ncbi:MAG: hypothetical protein AB7G17_06710 [Phycisphaerales bacterium]
MRTPTRVVLVLSALTTTPGLAQRSFLLADRNNDTLYRLFDANSDGVIQANEVSVWFDAANTPGTPGPLNTTALGAAPNGSVLMGDQDAARRCLYLFRDHNGDGDAQDAGLAGAPDESVIFVSPTNASGASTAFITGAAFDRHGQAFFVNAGNANGRDAVYLARDLNCDGDADDAGECILYLGNGAFGPGNGPFSPQVVVFELNADVGYLRNSSANLHGVYRFEDLSTPPNDNADDPGEFTPYWDVSATNQTGITPTAGFALVLDAARPRSLYTLQTASGGVDQLIRLTDLNSDKDAQDPGEATLVYDNASAGFTAVDIVSLTNGSVLLTDNSGVSVLVLTDVNGDGDFLDPGESALFAANVPTVFAQARQLVTLSRNPECPGDTNDDRTVNFADLNAVLSQFGAASVYGSAANVNAGPSGGFCAVTFADLNVILSNYGQTCAP